MLARALEFKPRQKWLCALGNTVDGVFIVDTAQRIIYWNKGAEKLLGHSSDDVLNQYCHQVLAGTRCSKLWCYAGCKVWKQVLGDVLPDNFDLLTHTKENKDIWVNVSTIVLANGSGKPLIIHLVRNTTQQKRNEDAIQNILASLGVIGSSSGNTNNGKSCNQGLVNRENKLFSLTRRELEVLSLLAEGLPTQVIVQRMGVSPFTVRSHIRNSLRKLGVHNKTQAVALVFRNGLI